MTTITGIRRRLITKQKRMATIAVTWRKPMIIRKDYDYEVNEQKEEDDYEKENMEYDYNGRRSAASKITMIGARRR